MTTNGNGQGPGKGFGHGGRRGAASVPQDKIDVAERRKRVVSLRLAGATFQQIADAIGYQNKASAYRAWQAAVSDIPRSVADEARRLEEARLDAMLAAIWPRVLRGNLQAIDRAVNISRRRARMLGLDAPVKVTGTLTDALDEEVKRLVAAMNDLGSGEQAAADLAAANLRESAEG